MKKYILLTSLMLALILVTGCTKTNQTPTNNTMVNEPNETDNTMKSTVDNDAMVDTKTSNTPTQVVTIDNTKNIPTPTEKKEPIDIPEAKPITKPTPKPMQISSPAFSSGNSIPAEYTCKGSDYNPQLNIALDELTNAKSIALIMDDPDAPNGTWVHWVVYNIDPKTTVIAKNSVPGGAQQGLSSWGTAKYGGPCPPSGTHRYYFKVYALDTTLSLSNPTKAQLENAMQGHVLDKAELMGKFSH